MRPEVEQFLSDRTQQNQNTKENQERAYRYRVTRAASLFEDLETEVTSEVFFSEETSGKKHFTETDDEGNEHYFIAETVPMELTDEEFAAVEKAFTAEELEAMRKEVLPKKEEKEETSFSASFFTTIGVFILLVGLIFSVIIAASTKGAEFTAFVNTFPIFLFSGLFCFCIAELFKKLQTIVNLLRAKK